MNQGASSSTFLSNELLIFLNFATFFNFVSFWLITLTFASSTTCNEFRSHSSLNALSASSFPQSCDVTLPTLSIDTLFRCPNAACNAFSAKIVCQKTPPLLVTAMCALMNENAAPMPAPAPSEEGVNTN